MQLAIHLNQKQSPSKIIDELDIWSQIRDQFENIPEPFIELLPGVKWGCYSKLFTPAFWKLQYLMHHNNEGFTINYRLGDNILEEVVACLLGGYGLKSEIGLAAFSRIKERGFTVKGVDYGAINSCLKEPFNSNGKTIHYRFPNQKSKFIHQFLNRSDLDKIPMQIDVELRDWLLTINGIGPKTASWIARNHLNSENVAIIDIHILRAGRLMGIFPDDLDVNKDYFKLERIFIKFCGVLNVQPSKMDALMWCFMKESNRTAIKMMSNL